MRCSRFPWLVTIVALIAYTACDPGSSVKDSTDPSNPNGAAGVGGTRARSPLLDTPYEPGPVEMKPPLAGELDVFAQNRALGRGMNIGNSLDSPKPEGSWGVKLHQYMFEVIKQAGFDSIRLPVRWSDYAEETAPYTISEEIFDRVDWAIAHTLNRGMRIVVDIHHYGEADPKLEAGIYAEPEKHHERFLALWKQIAEHYKDYPKELYFEILNEPRSALEPLWNQYMLEALGIIRQSNPGRTVIVGGIWWNKWDALQKVEWPADDQNLIATFHYYNPYCFTLQDGQIWEPACKIPGDTKRTPKRGEASWPVIYPEVDPNPAETEAAQRQRLEDDLAKAAAWSKTAQRPLYMGEFGVHSGAVDAPRVDYTRAIVNAANANGITWAYWELASGFGIWNKGAMAWDQPMLDALFTGGPTGAGGAAGTGGAGGNTGGGGTSSEGLGLAGMSAVAGGGGSGF